MEDFIIQKNGYIIIDMPELDFVKIAITTKEIDAKNKDEVYENLKEEFTLENLSKNKQIHSDIVNKVDKSNIGVIIDGDAIITDEKNVPLLILTADCVPIVLVDKVNKAVGLVHAGWKGTYAKIPDKTLKKMEEFYNTNPKEVIAIIGPSIGKCCYEVSLDLVEKFGLAFEDIKEDIYEVINDKYYLDLWEINKRVLEKSGVLDLNILNLNICTSCNCDKFFSYRKHDKTPKRIGTFIEIK